MPFFDNVKRIRADKADQFFIGDDCAVLGCLNKNEYVLLPGFCDVHVHFREPGFSYKETISSGSHAAARGGYTAVCTMPNLNPICDNVEHLALQEELIQRDAVIDIRPYAAITVEQKGEQLVDMETLAPRVIAFSDDGHGIQTESMMREAMERAKALGKMIVAHCEDNSLLHGGYIHDGQYAAAHNHRGICAESEWRQVKRDLRLAMETGCAYHICHVSTKESVALIREAKRAGVNVSCETAPHYLLLDENDLQEDGRFKMNPPLRAPEDREGLIEGLLDGTIDMIATDHAPHSKEEKSRGLEKSAFGIVGIETAFPLLYTGLVKTGILSLEALIDLLCEKPRKRFNIPIGNDFSIWNLNRQYTIDPREFLSQSRATPFADYLVYGRCMMTVYHGKAVYYEEDKNG
ncbi:MAG: dihydroorotase [Oscillospiraceae bacterium]|nr:dihydroorotase [Oscillospiraceae bacterium]